MTRHNEPEPESLLLEFKSVVAQHPVEIVCDGGMALMTGAA